MTDAAWSLPASALKDVRPSTGILWVLAAAGLAAVAAPAAAQLPERALHQAVAVAEALALERAPVPARVVVEPGAPDARLRLAPCDEYRATASPGAPAWGRTRVLLHCVRGPVAWRIALPVTVQVWAPAWVAARPRTAGEKLAADHVVPGVVDWAAAATPPLPLSQPVTGRMLARALDAGAPLREADLRSRQWFAAGDTVRVTARGSGFSVQAEAQALTPGFEGLPARLQAANGRVFSATPVAERQAEARP
ncbi:MAG: flagellar basal body P-ring formation protein FlgA [Ideonella sp. WA131b]|jgi:flagella basal body P-ring formation protein FlgA|nr:flagellar basal body P-ring formation protein FlgA [Ideonella sp. WA131b]